MSRKIIHIDQDCFYAAVEVRDNPRLQGRPVAVGGSSDRRGVLTTANYEARKYGVRSAMSTSQALKLCPNLVLVPVHFAKYRSESLKIREIFKQYTDKIEPLSLDEAYLDVSHCEDFQGSASLLAQQIRKEIFKKTGLTASAGIAPNKFLAKVASDWNKPNGQFTVAPKDVAEFVRKLPVKKIPGVGKVTAGKMTALGYKTCGDLQRESLEQMNHLFGSWGVRLYDLCRGVDHRVVRAREKRKSLSVERTFPKDLQTLQDCLEVVGGLYEELERRLEQQQNLPPIESLMVKLKFSDFQQTTVDRSQWRQPERAPFQEMVEEAYSRGMKPVRLLGLGVRLKSPKPSPPSRQLSLQPKKLN